MAVDSGVGGEIVTIRKREYYQFNKALVATYTTEIGNFGAYSLFPFDKIMRRDGSLISMIAFDRNGDAKKISEAKFMKLIEERGVEEIPPELSVALEPQVHRPKYTARSKRRVLQTAS